MNDERSTEFVNRRGRKTSGVVAQSTPAASPVKQHPKMKPKRRLAVPRLKLPKLRLGRRAGIVAIVVVLVAAGLLLLSADSVKRDYERQTAAMRRSVVEAGKHIPSQETGAADVAAGLLGALGASSQCRASGLDVVSWYGPAKTARHTCQQRAQDYTRLVSALQSLQARTRYIDQISSIFRAPIAQPTGSEYAIASEYAENWTKAAEALPAVMPPDALKPTHATIMTASRAVATAWTKMRDAATAESRDQFTAAEAELQRVYKDFREATEALRGGIVEQQTIIDAQVKRLLSS